MNPAYANSGLFRGELDCPDIAFTATSGAITVPPELFISVCKLRSDDGAETRTLSDPARAGQILMLYMFEDDGDIVITPDTAIDEAESTTFTFSNVGEMLTLIAIEITSTTFAWRIIGNEGLSAKGCVDIPLMSFINGASTRAILAIWANGASPTPGFDDAGEEFGIKWNNHANPDVIITSLAMPKDLDTTKDAIVEIFAHRSATNSMDLVTFTVQAFQGVVGAAADADADFGGASSAMLDNVNIQKLTRTLAAADLSSTDGALTITIGPTDGLLATIDVTIIGVRLLYTKKLLAS